MSRTQIPFRLFQMSLLAAGFLLAFSAASLHAENNKDAPPDWKKTGKWSALTQYIGTYEYDKIFDDKDVKATLATMLKGRDIDLKTEFAVSTSVGFEEDCLVLRGNRKSAAHTNSSYMQVCVSDGTINLAVQDGKTITIFTTMPDYKYMSQNVRNWIYFTNNGYKLAVEKPDNVQMVITAP